MKQKVRRIQITKDELEVLMYIIDDWRDIKSETLGAVRYPNGSITSTKIIQALDNIWKKF